jgi:hypothetical protein
MSGIAYEYFNQQNDISNESKINYLTYPEFEKIIFEYNIKTNSNFESKTIVIKDDIDSFTLNNIFKVNIYSDAQKYCSLDIINLNIRFISKKNDYFDLELNQKNQHLRRILNTSEITTFINELNKNFFKTVNKIHNEFIRRKEQLE